MGAVCVVLMTDVIQYFAMMTSSNWLIERDALQKWEAMSFPLPDAITQGKLEVQYSKLKEASESDTKAKTLLKMLHQAYELDECESVLIRDALEYELDYFRRGSKSNSVKP